MLSKFDKCNAQNHLLLPPCHERSWPENLPNTRIHMPHPTCEDARIIPCPAVKFSTAIPPTDDTTVSKGRIRDALPGSMTSVHAEVGASHEARSVTQEKDGRATVLFWVAQPAQHIVLGPVLLPVGELLEKGCCHCSHDVARGNSVHTDAVRSPFHGQVPRELEHAGLGGVVGSVPWSACDYDNVLEA